MSFEAPSAERRNTLLREDVRRDLRDLRSSLKRGLITPGSYLRDAQVYVHELRNLRAEAEAGFLNDRKLVKPSKPSGIV